MNDVLLLESQFSLCCVTDLSVELQIRTTDQKHTSLCEFIKKVENAKKWNVNFMQHGGPYLHGVMTQGCNIQKISGVFLWVSFALN